MERILAIGIATHGYHRLARTTFCGRPFGGLRLAAVQHPALFRSVTCLACRRTRGWQHWRRTQRTAPARGPVR